MKRIVIERHVTPTSQHRDSLAYESARMEEMLANARASADNLHWVYSYGMATAQLGSVVDVRSPLVPRGLRLAAEAVAGNFRLQRGRGRGKTIRLDGEKVVYATAKPNREYRTPGDWVKGFCIAMICRDVELLDELCRTSGDDLRRINAVNAEYRFLLVDGIRQAWRGENPEDALVAAMEATDPEREDMQTHANVTRVLRLEVPLIQLIWYVASGDPDFGKLHAEAVKRHKAYWTKTARLKRSWHGFLAIELTAVAAWANDWKRGALAARSDYVPEYLVQGDFLD
jgi:hypothetical protein